MAILFTFGASDIGDAEVRPDPKGQMTIYLRGGTNVFGMVDLGRVQMFPYLLYGGNAEQPPPRFPVRPTLVFNQISDPDSHRIAMERCVELCDALKVPVINHPRHSLRNSREQLPGLLKDIPGVRVPKTIRCAPRSPGEILDLAEEAGFGDDFIFRTTGEHNGANMVRVRGPSELEKLHAFPLDGRDFYLIEFVEFGENEEVYRKHRILMIDGEPHAKHSTFHEHWKIHIHSGGGKDFVAAHPEFGRPAELLEELVTTRLPLAEEKLKEIARRVGLDFLVIDCHIGPGGDILVFEANANANPLGNSPSSTPENDQMIRSKVSEMILRRLSGQPSRLNSE